MGTNQILGLATREGKRKPLITPSYKGIIAGRNILPAEPRN